MKETQFVQHKTKLNPKQEKFCKLYSSDKEFFGNGVESYLEAYDLPPSKYKSASVSAGRLLGNASILARINELLSITINDQMVDKELGFTILQKRDLSSKVAAIKEYNRVKNRVDDSPKVLMIGQILQNVESVNRTKTLKQGLSVKEFLLDQEQEEGAGSFSKESGSTGV